MASKYTPLELHLRNLPASQKQVVLSFEQIESILKSRLPDSAYEDHRWWEHETEGNHRNTRAWSNAGWSMDEVDVRKKRARFARRK